MRVNRPSKDGDQLAHPGNPGCTNHGMLNVHLGVVTVAAGLFLHSQITAVCTSPCFNCQ